MSAIPIRLWEAYLRAEYWVGPSPDRLRLHIGERAAGLSRLAPGGAHHSTQPWAYLTAWNPGSEVRMEFVNREKQEELEFSLRHAGIPLLPGMSRDPSGEWPDEEGIVAFGLGWERALGLGRKFGQNAILAGMGEDVVQLLRC